MPFRALIRFGSTTESDIERVELNSVKAVKNSSNKLLMKQCFKEGKVKTADWTINPSEVSSITENWEYKCVAKSHYGSRGEGNTLISSQAEFNRWLQGKTVSNYIFEKFYNYTREYRLHVNEEGCFYTCRKMLKSDAPEDASWFRNDSNCVWFVEDNSKFDKPVNWDIIVGECIKAIKAVGLDFGAIDLRIQSSKDKDGRVRKDPDFIVVEVNSAPSFGSLTLEAYMLELPIMLKKKFLSI